MKEFFNRYQIAIFRVVGSLMLLIGFVMYFWNTPKEGLSQNEIAAANVARMEARMAGGSYSVSKANKPSHTPIMKSYRDTQAKQMRYVLILAMVLGIGFLGYSFVKKRD